MVEAVGVDDAVPELVDVAEGVEVRELVMLEVGVWDAVLVAVEVEEDVAVAAGTSDAVENRWRISNVRLGNETGQDSRASELLVPSYSRELLTQHSLEEVTPGGQTIATDML